MITMITMITTITTLLLAVARTVLPGAEPPATDPPDAEAEAEAEATAAIEAPDLAPIQAAVAELRGLAFKRDVPAAHQTREEFAAYIEHELDAMFPEDRAADMMSGLLMLGMLTEPIDVEGELRDAILTQAGGYYDPESGTFYYLMSTLPMEMLDTIAAHELVHALQDQHFDLGKLVERLEAQATGLPRNDDATLAVRFLLEGEATYVQTMWQLKEQFGFDPIADPGTVRQALEMQAGMELRELLPMLEQQMKAMGMGGDNDNDAIAEAMTAMTEIPTYFLYPLYAAYMSGPSFVAHVHADGGWEAVDAMHGRLPESAEQTLHPEKYAAETLDRPTPVSLDAVTAPAEAGWTLIDAAIHGEYYLRLLLENHGVTSREARRAAAGWDGDLYQAWRGPDGAVGVVMLATWDSEQDAAEFADALAESFESRFEDANVERSEDGATTTVTWGKLDGDAGASIRRGRETMLVLGFTAPTREAIIDQLAATRVEHVE